MVHCLEFPSLTWTRRAGRIELFFPAEVAAVEPATPVKRGARLPRTTANSAS